MSKCPLSPWIDAKRANASARVIILSDVANEADDSFAIAHALLTPSFDVRAIVAQHFGVAGSAERSAAAANELLGAMPDVDVPVVVGAEAALTGLRSDRKTLYLDGARVIVEEALREDPRPLFVLGMGPLTDVALALDEAPEATNRFTLVWVGGGRYPHGSHEANLARDIVAAQQVFESGISIWQIPSGAYKTLEVPISEFTLRLGRAGALGEILLGRMRSFASAHVNEKHWIQPESWVLGDQAAVGVFLAEQKACWHETSAPSLANDCSYESAHDGRHSIRAYDSIDTRLVLEDMFAKFELYEQLEGRKGCDR